MQAIAARSVLWLLTLALLPAVATAADDEHAHSQDTDAEPPWSQADEHYDPEEMRRAREQLQHHHGSALGWLSVFERTEIRGYDGTEFVWDASGWVGGDINKFLWKTEGEYDLDTDELEDGELQALWSHAISPYWDIQLGYRQDVSPRGTAYAVFGVHGLAPYWWEVDVAVFVSHRGDVFGRAEIEYEWTYSKQLILQFRAEINLSLQAVEEQDVIRGITQLEAGMRLRYEVTPRFAPYVGIRHALVLPAQNLDNLEFDTNSYETTVLLGLRGWY